ncbi:uncharacterized protein LOC103307889 [Acyrthosiphon pisum]|uniref:DNA helicase Pif1-like 2B domain-containing protein n=1 Tax=Acyrthosiphon pisum TaxID=7029 RepID=A0A8R1X0E2_ACYPI|nr:uncharacterized protein LOC103307889 [Acyrthosiphon pisum]|eukprot:XP_008178533.1 PREDICTED: uncharacterized protein LOC103307889 [Acyrthosiphon pisum]
MDWLCERAILTPKNERAPVINEIYLKSLKGTEIEYKSIGMVLKTDDAVLYLVEILNALNPPGFPAHKLVLKVGTPIMLLRNLHPPKLCNGCAQGESTIIPRIPLLSSNYPFEFKRLQFPIKVSFSMTINKSQGQSLKIAGIDLSDDCFTHGQFYVACSRVSSPTSLVNLAPN